MSNRFDTDDKGNLLTPWTFMEMDDTRRETIEQLAMDGDEGESTLTCDNCRAVATCPFAFDPYNTNGDCLAEK